MQNTSVRNYLQIQPYFFSAENETSRAEVHLPRDGYGLNVNGLPILANNEDEGNNGIKSYIPDEMIWDWKYSQMNQANEVMDQPHEQDKEIGYEESTSPATYEGLEHKFIDEIMKLTRDRSDAEDAEFARHKERILEINTEYQEKLSSLGALQATQREEFLRKELHARVNQHHEGRRNHCPNMNVADAYGYVCPPILCDGEAIDSRFHGAIEYKHDGERTLRSSRGRSRGGEAKVPLPPGRVYNNSAVYH
ncbi:hypothetical protein PHAVU_007G136700 [Phaseolus vulgaris]|uniref:Uncharacterized protein n=2 Tax=Phaseolus vulgaris TaxID=3885 RepID=V7BEF9_PHAVU|nr:hypothetical protein PHAVU_007G136700g [Phaseolus vulgaris]ESW16197.1 hypothetical protein PHAVU_007G136700g [Phaseolus vulgaris]